MLFKILQCSCFNIAGTVIATLLSGRALRLVAVAHAMIWGALRGVLNISWYQMLSAFVPGRSPQDVLVKVLLDQLVYTPAGSVIPRLLVMSVLEGRGVAAGVADVRGKLLGQLLVGWKIWPFVHAANFFFVPDEWQLLTIWTTSLVYITIIELASMRSTAQPAKKEKGDDDATKAGSKASPKASSKKSTSQKKTAAAATPVRRNPPRKAKSNQSREG